MNAKRKLTGNGVCWITDAELALIKAWLNGDRDD